MTSQGWTPPPEVSTERYLVLNGYELRGRLNLIGEYWYNNNIVYRYTALIITPHILATNTVRLTQIPSTVYKSGGTMFGITKPDENKKYCSLLTQKKNNDGFRESKLASLFTVISFLKFHQ